MPAPASTPEVTPPVPDPVRPAFDGACIANVVPALLDRDGPHGDAGWMPELVGHASQVVLLVVDGLGWEQLRARPHLAPVLSSAQGLGAPITSVAPSTTACALTSITTGRSPSEHGILGYRMSVGGEILNVLRWTTGSATVRDARRSHPARELQPFPSFPGSTRPVPVVSKGEFGGTGFTAAHLGNSPLHGYRVLSSLPLEVGRLLRDGEPFVYAYYDGIDKVAHGDGFGAHYDAELRAVDLLVAEVAAQLPSGAVLVVTADHGQIDVGTNLELIGREIMSMVGFLSGEGRFRWLHARDGAADDLLEAATERYGQTSLVLGRDQLVDDGLLGGPLTRTLRERLGDVALLPLTPSAFIDPADTGESRLQCRHGSLTPDEMLVPLVALAGDGNI